MCVADTVPTDARVKTSYERGRPRPLTRGATSKVILAQLPTRRLTSLLGAHEAGITVTMTIAAGLDRVMVDRVQIQQVLVNLIRNAIQSMAVSPTRELTIATAPDRAGWVRVTVADTGIGIAPDIRARLFDAFATTKADGMGLGLSICRTIVEAHGGRIWAEAGGDGGTAFHFCVPLAGDDDV